MPFIKQIAAYNVLTLLPDFKVSWELQCNAILHCNHVLLRLHHFYLQCSSKFSLVCYGFYLLFTIKKEEYSVAKECCLHSKLFYLSTVSTISLSLAVNFHSSALLNLVPLIQFQEREKHPWRSITFSKVILQLFLKWHSSMGVFYVF